MIAFSSFDAIFQTLFEFAPEGTLTLTLATDGTWSADLAEASTVGAPSAVDALGIALMQFVRDEEIVFHNATEVNRVLSEAVGAFVEKVAPSFAEAARFEIYYSENGRVLTPWEAVIVIERGDTEVYSIECGHSPGEALRKLIGRIHNFPDAGYRSQLRNVPPAQAQFAAPPNPAPEYPLPDADDENGDPTMPPTRELQLIEETAA
jgi:hypothetical protein